MIDIMQDKYILGQSSDKTIDTVGQEIRLDLKLDPNTNTVTGGTVTGTVTTATGDPIENALIKIMSSDYEPLMHTLTDSSGNYSFYNVTANNTYNIFAIASNMKLKQGNQFSISQFQEIAIDFTLEEDSSMKLGVIAGDLITQTTNLPVGGAVVSLFKINADTTETLEAISYTNQYGQFVFREIPIGNYLLKFSALGYNNIESNISITQEGQLVPLKVSISVNPNTARGTVSGIITDNSNQPIDRADVILYKVETDNSLTPKAFTKTNISGIYLFPNVEPGTYKVKSNQIDIVNIDVPDNWSYAPNLVGFELFYSQNYISGQYKASNGILRDGASINPTTGFVQGLDVGSVTLSINAPSTGAYYLAVSYLSSVDKILSVSINGANPLNVLCYQTPTTNPSDARTRYIHASLTAGQNTVKFYNKFQTEPPDIDLVTVEILPYASSFQPANGTLENGATASNNFVYGIGGTQNGSTTFNINVPIDGEYLLGIRYLCPNSNKPMKIEVDNGFSLNEQFAQTPTDNIADGVEARILIGDLTAGTHTVRFYNDTGAESPIIGVTQARIVVPIIKTFARNGLLENGAEVLASGYIHKLGGTNQGSVTMTVNVPMASKYSIGIEYVNATGIIGDMKVSVNGDPGVKYVFPKTVDNTVENSKMFYFNLQLNQGNNTLKLYNDENVDTQSPVINIIYFQRILIDTVYEITNPNISLTGSVKIENDSITNIGYGLGDVLIAYNNLPFYGPYFLIVKYVTLKNSTAFNLDVNSASTGERYTFEATQSLNVIDAKTKTIPVTLKVGSNTLRIFNNG